MLRKKLAAWWETGCWNRPIETKNVITGGDNSRSTHFLAKDLIATQRIDCTALSQMVRRSPSCTQATTRLRLSSTHPTLSFLWRKNNSKRATALHRVRDIDSPAPLSGDKNVRARNPREAGPHPFKSGRHKGFRSRQVSEDPF